LPGSVAIDAAPDCTDTFGDPVLIGFSLLTIDKLRGEIRLFPGLCNRVERRKDTRVVPAFLRFKHAIEHQRDRDLVLRVKKSYRRSERAPGSAGFRTSAKAGDRHGQIGAGGGDVHALTN
jgi:hypothetical protein